MKIVLDKKGFDKSCDPSALEPIREIQGKESIS
jgi:hypothetical protein